MKTIDRYIATLFLRNLTLSALGLAAIYSFQEILVQILDQNFPINQVLIYNSLNYPFNLVQMLPPAVLLATVGTLAGLARTQELVAIFSLGISLWRVLSVIFSLVFVASCIALILQDRVLPPMYRRKTVYYWHEMKHRPDFHLNIKKDKIWYRSGDLIYNLRAFSPEEQKIVGMSVYRFDTKFNLFQTIDAEFAVYGANGWKLQNGTITEYPKNDSFPVTQKFTEMALKIEESPSDFQEIEKEVDGLRLKELWSYITKMRSAGVNTNRSEVKFHSKISMSFIALVMCALGVPFSLRTRREGGVARDLGLCLGITFFYWLFYSVGLSLGSNGALSPVLAAWLPTMLFGGLATALIARRK